MAFTCLLSLTLLRAPWSVDTNITTLHHPQIRQQPSSLEVRVRMQNRVQLARRPQILILDLPELVSVLVLKDPIASNVVSLLRDVFFDALEQSRVRDACCIEQGDELIGSESPIGTTVASTVSLLITLKKGERELTVDLCLAELLSGASGNCTDCSHDRVCSSLRPHHRRRGECCTCTPC